jgi:pimeloyl-ACP methyl ester carboxylesterase
MSISDADLASIVSKAYSTPPTVQASNDVRTLLSTHGNDFVVACPGTTDIAGWLVDLDIWLGWFRTIGICHSGFGSKGKALWALVEPRLPKDKTIIFTGHSEGGALAQVMAALYAAQNLRACTVVTFGSPRITFALDWRFHMLLRRARRVVLYARRGDPVPDVPLKPLYLHAHRLTHIGEPMPEPPNPVSEIIGKIGNHDINLYAANLKAAESLTGA